MLVEDDVRIVTLLRTPCRASAPLGSPGHQWPLGVSGGRSALREILGSLSIPSDAAQHEMVLPGMSRIRGSPEALNYMTLW